LSASRVGPNVGMVAALFRRMADAVRYRRPREATWVGYARKARALGLERTTLFLSFDCDTDEDADAMPELHAFLASLGIAYTLAVPGEQLRRGAGTYKTLAGMGLEFMNHGQAPHTARRGDRYVSATFYHEMPPEAVERDIREGHETVLQVTGTAPRGFRAPHFGLFQKEAQLALVRRVARSLGYSYCSTTAPSAAMRGGPAFIEDGLVELPILGAARIPHKMYDSWSYLADPVRYRLSPGYARLGIETVDFFRDKGIPALLSWYADPSHVLGQPAFHALMEHLARRSVPSMTGRQLGDRFLRPDRAAR